MSGQWMKAFFFVYFGASSLYAAQPLPEQQTGTLVFNVQDYSSDANLPKKIADQLKHGGVEWTMVDHSLVISLVNQKFVNMDTLSLTRFGGQKTLEIKPGDYTVSCVAYELKTDSTNIDKVLSKNAFFNIDVLRFKVSPGKTTTIEVSPSFGPQSAWFRLSRVTMYVPTLTARVIEDGAQDGKAVSITQRTDKSVAWGDYTGPLKF